MKLVKIGAASLNQTPMDWGGNYDRIMRAVDLAQEDGVDILLTPEMSITGYGCEDMFLSPDVQNRAWEMMKRVGRNIPDGMVVHLGLPVLHRNALFNAVAVVQGDSYKGRVQGIVPKQNLAGDGIHYEPRWFNPWPAGVTDLVGDIPIGDLHFEADGIRFGFEVCEDAWVAQRPGGRLVKRGVDIILNPSASHFAFGKYEVRQGFVVEGSRAMNCTYVYANLLGNEAGRAIYDGGNIIAQAGKFLALGPRLTLDEVTLSTAVIDVDRTRMLQSWTHSFSPTLGEKLDCISLAGFPVHEKGLTPSTYIPRPPLQDKLLEFEEAATLGLYDYMRKTGSKGYVVSLSGGADSAACAELIGMMCKRAGLDPKAVLTTAYQATANSGDVTRVAALSVAEGVGCEHHVLDVDALVEGYKTILSQALGRELTWDKDDIALQNIQARVRSPSIWMFANIQKKLLVSTSNRSEAAVGYATMDGDTSGGIAPIAGIDKAFLRRWLIHRQAQGSLYLTLVNQQQPTAELRPADAGQTDEDDLMPYDVLDAIERLAIRDKKSPVECYDALISTMGFTSWNDQQKVYGWVQKFFRLWARNQWKRERYAPSFHYDDENLDPKTWCRFPILNSGFKEELEDLIHHH